METASVISKGFRRDLSISWISESTRSWISPIFPSPMRDFGYDVSDYRAIHPLFGSLADFDALLESRSRARHQGHP